MLGACVPGVPAGPAELPQPGEHRGLPCGSAWPAGSRPSRGSSFTWVQVPLNSVYTENRNLRPNCVPWSGSVLALLAQGPVCSIRLPAALGLRSSGSVTRTSFQPLVDLLG
ncbi:unnamed protein product [Rangifer tarandus platyrhynchus]|uniref:Uncharacterized protein n=1 Tax=Rangifer tarandus platyrhynchus TaxID=3082113 RepID=A0AC59YAV7_RANTA